METNIILPAPAFNEWDLDLLIDYVLKYHHRNIRTFGVDLTKRLTALCAEHPELQTVAAHLSNSVSDLDIHCQKEEQILFPFILEMISAANDGRQKPPFHCGTIQSPIRAMMMDHCDEIERHGRIAELTDNYAVPQNADDAYRTVMEDLRKFADQLREHTAVEDEIIFPRAIKLEMQQVG